MGLTQPFGSLNQAYSSYLAESGVMNTVLFLPFELCVSSKKVLKTIGNDRSEPRFTYLIIYLCACQHTQKCYMSNICPENLIHFICKEALEQMGEAHVCGPHEQQYTPAPKCMLLCSPASKPKHTPE